MATNDRPQFSSMSLTALRRYAKDDLGLKGLSKSDRETVMAAILAAVKPAKTSIRRRTLAYEAQRNGGRLTPRQTRRLRKNANKALGRKAA